MIPGHRVHARARAGLVDHDRADAAVRRRRVADLFRLARSGRGRRDHIRSNRPGELGGKLYSCDVPQPEPRVFERAEPGQATARLRELWGADRIPDLTDEEHEQILQTVADAKEHARRFYAF